jgi:hypothetical protein
MSLRGFRSSADGVRRPSVAPQQTAGMTDSPDPAAQQLRMTRVGLPDLLANIQMLAAPAGETLDAAIAARAELLEGDEQQKQQRAVEQTPHFDVLEAWCRENPKQAAGVVLCAVYLAHGRFIAQEAAVPSPAPATDPAEGVAEG